MLRGGPFDTTRGAMVFLRDQTFFRLPAETYNFFRPYQKQTIFFSAVEHKTIFSPFFHLILRTLF